MVISTQDVVVLSSAWIGHCYGVIKDLLWNPYRYVRYEDDWLRIEHLHETQERQQPGLRPRHAD